MRTVLCMCAVYTNRTDTTPYCSAHSALFICVPHTHTDGKIAARQGAAQCALCAQRALYACRIHTDGKIAARQGAHSVFCMCAQLCMRAQLCVRARRALYVCIACSTCVPYIQLHVFLQLCGRKIAANYFTRKQACEHARRSGRCNACTAAVFLYQLYCL